MIVRRDSQVSPYTNNSRQSKYRYQSKSVLDPYAVMNEEEKQVSTSNVGTTDEIP
jgi:hypothetical protein